MSASACHTPDPPPADVPSPWAGDPRGDDKDALAEYARQHPEGTPVIQAARDVLGGDVEPGDADHRLALRFFQNHPDLFETDSRDGLRWVEPRAAAFHSTPTNKRGPKHADVEGVEDDTPDVPRENARTSLNRHRTVESDATRGILLGTLATYRETSEDRYHALADTFNPGEYRLIPYSTRFNSPRRVRDSRERFDAALSAAAERYDRGVMMTVTTDPNRLDSLADATDCLMADVNRLKSWLATDSRLGFRPPSIVVPEFTDSGLPHAHVVLFGVSWVVPHQTLSAYWSDSRDRGSIVWFDRLTSRSDGGRWRWAEADGPEDGHGRRPRAYLAKTLDALASLARATPEDVRDASDALRNADAEDVDCDALADGRTWWKLAAFYAFGVRLFTCSPTLKPDGGTSRAPAPDGTPLPPDAPSRWRYVGTAKYGEFPAHVRRNATLLARGRPPPGGVAATSNRQTTPGKEASP